MQNGKLSDLVMMMKPNLSLMISFSSISGYLLSPGMVFKYIDILVLFVGGMLITSASNIINQIIERDTDLLMKRTSNRPLPNGRVSVPQAWIMVILSGFSGVILVAFYFNWIASSISFLSLLLYGFAYTPMKKIHPISTFIGAIPGALPPLIGWTAATGSFLGYENVGGWILFAIHFFWQFPHLWAIAWVAHEDYVKAGIRLLPIKTAKTTLTGLKSIFYATPLIPLALSLWYFGLSGVLAALLSVLAGIVYIISTVIFYSRNNKKSALAVMYTSFFYLPVVLIALLIDKF